MAKTKINPLAKEVPLALFKKTVSNYDIHSLIDAFSKICGSRVSDSDVSSPDYTASEIAWSCPLLLKDGTAFSVNVAITIKTPDDQKTKFEIEAQDKWIYMIPEMNPDFVKELHLAWCTALNTAMSLLENRHQGIQLWWPEKTMLSRLGWNEDLDDLGEEQSDAAKYLMYALNKDSATLNAWPHLAPWTNTMVMLNPSPVDSDNYFDWIDWSRKLGTLYQHEASEQIELPSGTVPDEPTL